MDPALSGRRARATRPRGSLYALLGALALALALAACGARVGAADGGGPDAPSLPDATTTHDALDATPADVPAADARTLDAPATDAPSAGALYQQCARSSDCRDVRRPVCLTNTGTLGFPLGFPAGYCTAPCRADAECGPRGACLDFGGETRYCMQGCSRGAECRDGYSCFPTGRDDGMGVCWPLCTRDAQCGAGATCDTFTGYCAPPGPPPPGDPNGAPCAVDLASGASNCRGQCLAESYPDPMTGAPRPSGYVGGMCYSLCPVPREWSDPTLDRFPRGTCPADSACVPEQYATAEPGDLGYCVPTCGADADCRPGYQCYLPRRGATAFVRGLCTPIDCNDGAHACPAGYRCVTGLNPRAPMVGVCAREPRDA